MKKKIIAVFTGNRAEYGLQFPILKAINDHPDLEYRLIVSGAHLDADFGSTLKEIESDGFKIHAEVKIDLDEDTLFATSKAIGTGIISMGEVLDSLKPDFLVVYADRFEGFAAVIAGSQMNIPTAHIEGGDITEGGALDDSVRHAMTKLSHIHFTTNRQATNRILAMGEEAWRVHTVGFPAIDLIQEGNFATENELTEQFEINLNRPIVLFTQHSVTTEFKDAVNQTLPSLDALKQLAKKESQIIITYPNNDAGGRRIIDEIMKVKTAEISNIQIHKSLGRYNYHGFLSLARNREVRIVCAGNSSSGIKETSVFGCPTVNIGSRQKGRLRAENIIDADYNTSDILEKINTCFYDDVFRTNCFHCKNPYGIGDAGIKIADILSKVEINPGFLRKGMTLKGEEKKGWFR